VTTPDAAPGNRRRASIIATVAIGVAGLLATACATVVSAPASLEAERFLPPGALAYARLDKATLSAALARLPDAAGAAAVADRTDSMTVAFVRPGASSKGGLVAVAEGRYPAGAASLKLSTDPAWRRNGSAWERKDGSLRLAFAQGGRVLVGTAPIDGLLAAAESPHPYPIPERWGSEWSSAVAVYLPDPMALLRERLPLGDGAVPMVAMFLSGRPLAGGGYSASLSFEFETDRAAVVFAPLCRLFFYAAATALWPERSATVLDEAAWKTEGRVVRATGLPLEADSFAAFVGMAGL